MTLLDFNGPSLGGVTEWRRKCHQFQKTDT